jgi:DNA adenine methylase
LSNLKNENISIYPFLKWAGSKRLLLPELIKHVPLKFNKYYEPFLGGGALFFFIKPKRAFLSDTNAELINTYLQVRNNLNKLISCLKEMKFSKKEYMRIRALQTQDKIERAARFIFLNKTCWNGLYRVNMSGKFNVPVGSSKNPTIFCLDNLLAVSKVLKNEDLRV